jgi:hypothetical protein
VQKKLEALPNEVRWYMAKRRKSIREMEECWQKDLALAFRKTQGTHFNLRFPIRSHHQYQ